jgi:hypothetical protein
MASSFTRFLDHTRHITIGRTPLDEWSASRRALYLTTHNRQTFMTPVGFEPTIAVGKQPKTYTLDCAANGTSIYIYISTQQTHTHTHIHTYMVRKFTAAHLHQTTASPLNLTPSHNSKHIFPGHQVHSCSPPSHHSQPSNSHTLT